MDSQDSDREGGIANGVRNEEGAPGHCVNPPYHVTFRGKHQEPKLDELLRQLAKGRPIDAKYSSGGTKTRKMTWGSSAGRGSPGTSASTTPPSARSAGCGIPNRRART